MSDLLAPTLSNGCQLSALSPQPEEGAASGHGGNIYEFARRLGISPHQVLDFSASINPFGPPPELLEALKEELPFDLRHYPDPAATAFRETLSRRWRIPAEHFVAGNGSNELLPLLLQAINPRRIHLPVPNFGEYFKTGFPVETYPFFHEEDLRSDWLDQILSSVGPDELILLSNPNNPTGQLLSLQEKEALLKTAVSRNCWLLVDEAFMDFVGDEENSSLMGNILDSPRLVVLRSLTKFYAIPGLRLGYAAGPVPLMEALARKKDPWSVNSLAQKAGILCLNLPGFDESSRHELEKNRRELFEGLMETANFRPFASAANFLLVEMKGNFSASELQKELDREKILVRNCRSFAGLSERWIRIAIRSGEENRLLLKRLKEADRRG